MEMRHRAEDQRTESLQATRPSCIEQRNGGQRVFGLPVPATRPEIRPRLRVAPEAVESRYFQLLSRHAMMAPFLKEMWGWAGRDTYLWCAKGRQSREHLFKECIEEIRTLWREVGEIGGEIGGGDRGRKVGSGEDRARAEEGSDPVWGEPG